MLSHVLTFCFPPAGHLKDAQDRESSSGAHVLSRSSFFIVIIIIIDANAPVPTCLHFSPKDKALPAGSWDISQPGCCAPISSPFHAKHTQTLQYWDQ